MESQESLSGKERGQGVRESQDYGAEVCAPVVAAFGPEARARDQPPGAGK